MGEAATSPQLLPNERDPNNRATSLVVHGANAVAGAAAQRRARRPPRCIGPGPRGPRSLAACAPARRALPRRSTARRSTGWRAARTTRARSRSSRPFRYRRPRGALRRRPRDAPSCSTASRTRATSGAILRTARAAGVGGVVLPQDRSVGRHVGRWSAPRPGLRLRPARSPGSRTWSGPWRRSERRGFWLVGLVPGRRPAPLRPRPADRVALVVGRGGRGAPPAGPPDLRFRGRASRWRRASSR